MDSRSRTPATPLGGTGYRRRRAAGIAGTIAFALLATATAIPTDAARAQDATYVALGDSYSSGLGTGEYYDDGTECKRSPYSFPVLSADAIGAELTLAACSDAEVPGVLKEQLDELDSSTTHVTVSVGGNDAGFTSVLTQCALPWPWTCWDDIDQANQYVAEDLPGSLDNLYDEIANRAPDARVVAVGYPRLFNGEDCNAGTFFSPEEQAELNATADLLAQVTANRAAAHDNGFVDPRSRFLGHAVCADEEWLNGLSHPIGESYHPNRVGHSSGYAPLVTEALQSDSTAPAPQARTDRAPQARTDLASSSVAERHDSRPETTAERPGKAEIRAIHEHLVRYVAPCLRSEGYDVAPSPSLAEFTASYGTADGWDPFEPLDAVNQDERQRAVDACSQFDKLEWDYPVTN